MGEPRKREVCASTRVDHGSYHPDGKLHSAGSCLRMKYASRRFRHAPVVIQVTCAYTKSAQKVGDIILIQTTFGRARPTSALLPLRSLMAY